jgi:hypothetical protein
MGPLDGAQELLKKVVPADPAGLLSVDKILIARDEKTYIYGYARITSDLYLVSGLNPHR